MKWLISFGMLLCSMIKPAPVKLKEDDFPSLSSAAVSSPMTPAYTAQSRKHSSFQDEDFPALVSKIRPQKPMGNSASAWSQGSNKNTSQAPKVIPAPSSFASANPPLPSAAQPRKKSTVGGGRKVPTKIRSTSSSEEDDPQIGKTTQEIRSVPTMLDISSLLLGKSSTQSGPKSGKRKKQPTSSTPGTPSLAGETVSSMAQKENVPETKQLPANIPKPAATSKTNLFVNGHIDKPSENNTPALPKEPPGLEKPSAPVCPPPEEEEFPALAPKKPPPGRLRRFPDSDRCIYTFWTSTGS